VHDHVSTRELGWILDRSPGSIRDMIKAREIDAIRIVDGFRVPKAEALRLARERIEAEDGRHVSNGDLEQLIDELIATNEKRLATADSS
jgi:hypothetical protein